MHNKNIYIQYKANNKPVLDDVIKYQILRADILRDQPKRYLSVQLPVFVK